MTLSRRGKGDRSTAPARDDVDAATEAALRILRGAGQTEVTLRHRLEARGFHAATARAAASEAARLGYVDDAAFARSLAERRIRRGYGVRAVRAELRARGVGETPIEDVTAQVGAADELESAVLIARRLTERERDRRSAREGTAERVAAALARRGFELDTIRASVRTALGETPVGD